MTTQWERYRDPVDSLLDAIGRTPAPSLNHGSREALRRVIHCGRRSLTAISI